MIVSPVKKQRIETPDKCVLVKEFTTTHLPFKLGIFYSEEIAVIMFNYRRLCEIIHVVCRLLPIIVYTIIWHIRA